MGLHRETFRTRKSFPRIEIRGGPRRPAHAAIRAAQTRLLQPMATIRVRSAEGEETIWPRAAAAEQATALNDWIESAADDGGAFATPVPGQALHALAAFAEQCASAAASGGEAAREAAASVWAAEKERSPAELAQLLHGTHFLEMPNARLAIGREFCARLAATASPDELAALLEAACDLSDEERHAALSESIFEPEGPNDSVQAPAAPQPAAPQRTVSSQLANEDAIEEALSEADVPTLRKLKGVSRSWRARARRALCARYPADLTDLDIEPFLKADGPGVTHVSEAMAQLPNLAHMHAHGFVVDVAAVRSLGPTQMWKVRSCIGGDGEPPGGLLLAVRAARCSEAHVPEGALSNSTLASIEVPAGLTSIGRYAFTCCSSLASVVLPAGLTSIGVCAFSRCSSLASVVLPAGLMSIDVNAFGGCTSLASVVLPAGLTSIGRYAFGDCSSLASVVLPASLTSIGVCAFHRCTSLASVVLPAGLEDIGVNAFPTGCTISRAPAQ